MTYKHQKFILISLQVGKLKIRHWQIQCLVRIKVMVHRRYLLMWCQGKEALLVILFNALISFARLHCQDLVTFQRLHILKPSHW
jgi:hypothetical protein